MYTDTMYETLNDQSPPPHVWPHDGNHFTLIHTSLARALIPSSSLSTSGSSEDDDDTTQCVVKTSSIS